MDKEDLIDFIWKMCNQNFSTTELEEVLPKAIFISKRTGAKGESLIKIVSLLVKLKKKGKLEVVNQETIEIVDLIFKNQPLLKMGISVDYCDIIEQLLIPYKLRDKLKGDDVIVNRRKFELLFANMAVIMKNQAYFNKIMLLYSYNKEIFDLLLTIFKCKDILKEKEIEDPTTISTIFHIYGYFYDEQKKYNNDLSILEKLVTNISDSPNKFTEYCNNEKIRAASFSIAQERETYEGIEKLLDSLYEYNKTNGESKK